VSPVRPWILRARTATPLWFSTRSGGVEEEHLPDLRLERIEPEGGDRRSLSVLGDGQLQLGTVRTAHERKELRELVAG